MSIKYFKRVFRQLAANILSPSVMKKTAAIGARVLPGTTIHYAFKALAINSASNKTIHPNVEFVVYYAEPQAQSHFDLWDPVFRSVHGKYASVFRHAIPWWRQRDVDTAFAVSNIEQSEALFARMPNLKCIFYPANNGLNLQAVRHTAYQHVFLGHGDSNKASSANKAFRLYDEVWIAGQAHQDRFAKIPGNYSAIDFRIIGQPWMQAWLRTRPNYLPQIQTEWAYFPTWGGYYKDTNYSSLSEVAGITQVARKYAGANSKGWYKLHPWTRVADHRATMTQTSSFADVVIMEPSAQLRDALHKPLMFVICDVSAALTECLYINVPIFLYRPSVPAILNPEFDTQNAFCYIFRDTKELDMLMERVLVKKDDFLASQRSSALHYLVDIDKTKNGHFYQELERLSTHMPPCSAAI